MSLEEMGRAARAASTILKTAPRAAKDKALQEAACEMRHSMSAILEANEADLAANAEHLTRAQKDRLLLTEKRIEAIAESLEKIVDLPDPVGEVMTSWTVPSGLKIERVRVPLGVVGLIYESRPNVTADASGLCMKSGNACILRAGSESLESAKAIAACMKKGLAAADLPQAAVQLIGSSDRALVGELLRMTEYVDVLIPRGGKSLIARVQEESRLPVLAHLDGLCHTYVDGGADLEMAKNIVLNAKMRRTGICGATETLLIDKAVVSTHLVPILEALIEAGCEIRGDEATRAQMPSIKEATEEDWSTEYLEAILSVRVVHGVREAVRHIERYGSHHTDSIVTNDPEAAAYFIDQIDSAIVLHNASTQFADGGEFGMGAEIGIATGRLHARGPVGLEQLTTYKNVVHGKGQIRPA